MGTVSKKADVLHEVQETFGQIPEWVGTVPEPMLSGFWSLMRDFQLGETKIPAKYKELIGLAVAGATRCRYCQVFHTEAARLNGATDDEIREAAGIAGMSMFASTYLNALAPDLQNFTRETHEIVAYVRSQLKAAPHGRPERQPHV